MRFKAEFEANETFREISFFFAKINEQTNAKKKRNCAKNIFVRIIGVEAVVCLLRCILAFFIILNCRLKRNFAEKGIIFAFFASYKLRKTAKFSRNDF